MANTLSFDEAYYLSQNPDVAAAISRGIFTSGAQHYQLNGRFEGRNPNAFFNTSFYLGQYPDVAKAGINPLTHFLTFGVLENRATNAAELTAIDKDGNGLLNEFDAAAYLTANKDVADAIKAGTITSAYQHFIQFGQFEGRAAPLTNGTTVTGPFSNAGAGGSTFTLTAGIDNLVGTSGNDTFNASNVPGTPAVNVLGSLDKIDGGAGIDTLNITDSQSAANASFNLPAGFSVTNVERMVVSTNGSIGQGGTANFDVSGFSGLTSFVGAAAGVGAGTGSAVKVANTTDVTLTVSGNSTASIDGGKAIVVNAGTGAVSVAGSALTSVAVTGGGGAAINNASTAGVANTGTTLTSVTLSKVEGDSSIGGQGLATVNVNGATTAAQTITVTNAKANHTVALNVDGTGYKADGTAALTTFADANAQSITVNATGAKSNVSLAGSSAATTITTTGSADLALATGSIGTLTKIDGSAATGGLTLGALNAATVNVATGSGADSFAINATTKVTVDAGAGNDIVTLTSALAAGSTINLGAGDDVLLGTTAVAASTSSATTVIDGGAGIDSVSTGLINAGNAAQFVNFEKLSIASGTSFDASLMTKSTITGVSIDGAASGTVSGLTNSQSLVITADNTANSTTTLQFSNVTGTSDAYDISFNAKTTGTTASPASITADIVEIQGIENVSIHSNSAAGVASNSIVLKDAAARSLVIDGSQALTVAFDTAFGTAGSATGVTTINGSAATGALNINVANVNAAAAGLTVVGGAGADTFTASNFAATFTGNGGIDKYDLTNALNTGAVVDAVITDFAKGESITFANKGVEVFTATKLDVSTAGTLQAAIDTAAAGDGGTNGIVKWFQFGNNTYIVDDRTNGGFDATTDHVVQLTGLVDLSTATFNGATTNSTLTF